MWETLQIYSGGIVAFFTIALVGATVVYIWVTCRLLKQTKRALLADMIIRVIEICLREVAEIGEDKKGKEEEEEINVIRASMKGYCEAFKEVDKKLGMAFEKLFLQSVRHLRHVNHHDQQK